METGFFNPQIGYWQTIGVPTASMLATYPAGTVEVPLKPGADYVWQNGAWVEAPPDPAALIAAYQSAIQLHIDTRAGERNYTSGIHAASYVGSTVPLWAAEGAAFVAWRDAVWVQSIALLAQVQGGQIAPPTVAEAIAGLPALVWP